MIEQRDATLRLVREGGAFMGTLGEDAARCRRANCGDTGSHRGRRKAGDDLVARACDFLVVDVELGEIKLRGICK
jgi:hypothetical protein